jgi:hypothetical protein
MSARLVREASFTLPLLGTASDDAAIIADNELSEPLRGAITLFAASIKVVAQA